MKSTNPVLGRIGKAAQQPQYSVPGQGAEYGYTYQGSPVQTGTQDVMTIDDVVVKTVSLIGVTTLLAAITWAVVPVPALFPTYLSAAILGLIVGLVISFKQVTNPVVLFAYAVIQGIFVGGVSKAYEYFFDGIVVQAVIATLSVFLIMAGLYKAKVIRATPMFMKVVIGAAAGLTVVMLINFVITLATDGPTLLRNGSPIAIGFSLICIVVAALMFVVNFKQIEDGIGAGLPRKYGWLGAFGILVELIWMYLEFLRLLSYFMGDD